MRVVHINTSDTRGGAARAALRLNKALNNLQVASQMLVQNKNSDYLNIKSTSETKFQKGLAKLRSKYNNLFLKFYKNRKKIPFSTAKAGVNISKYKIVKKSDIINLHWINSGFLSLKGLEQIGKLGKPIIWTLHDMWPFTGGCHYSGGCTKYQEKCGRCSVLNSEKECDISRKIWKNKRKRIENLDLTIVTCSKWLKECVRNSSLLGDLQVKVIPNTIDINVFKPIDKRIARNILNLPHDKKLVLFGAMNATSNSRKGFDYLKKSLKKVSDNNSKLRNELELLVFGASHSDDIEKLPFKTQFVGHLYDNYTLALCYSAADVFVGPSLEEAFGQTYSESMACGTPCVAFNHSGPKDIINHKENGYLARYKSARSLAKGINWVLESKRRLESLGTDARKNVMKKYSFEVVGEQYLQLYNELL